MLNFCSRKMNINDADNDSNVDDDDPLILRELPLPLLTHEYQNTFIAVSGKFASHFDWLQM